MLPIGSMQYTARFLSRMFCATPAARLSEDGTASMNANLYVPLLVRMPMARVKSLSMHRSVLPRLVEGKVDAVRECALVAADIESHERLFRPAMLLWCIEAGTATRAGTSRRGKLSVTER